MPEGEARIRRRRSAKYPENVPQGSFPKAQARHVPKPGPLFKWAEERPLEPQEQQPPRRRRARSSLPRLMALLVLLGLGLVLVFAMGASKEAQGQLQALQAQREEAARRTQAHKDEHLNARRNAGYTEIIQRYAREFGVDPSFISAIIKCESSFNPGAVSRVGARGLMQLMPDTGDMMARRLKVEGFTQDMLFDPETNIRFGAGYLAYLSDMFSGNPIMVASGYHAGPGWAKNWALSHAEDQKTLSLAQIPAGDTLSYVRKVMDAYAIYYEFDQGLAEL